jgi:hypothetical protein
MGDSTLTNSTVIAADNNCFVIEGICNFTDQNNKPAKLFYCDLYRFNNDKIAAITSYCVGW